MRITVDCTQSGNDGVLKKATAPPELAGGAVFLALSSAALLINAVLMIKSANYGLMPSPSGKYTQIPSPIFIMSSSSKTA